MTMIIIIIIISWCSLSAFSSSPKFGGYHRPHHHHSHHTHHLPLSAIRLDTCLLHADNCSRTSGSDYCMPKMKQRNSQPDNSGRFSHRPPDDRMDSHHLFLDRHPGCWIPLHSLSLALFTTSFSAVSSLSFRHLVRTSFYGRRESLINRSVSRSLVECGNNNNPLSPSLSCS